MYYFKCDIYRSFWFCQSLTDTRDFTLYSRLLQRRVNHRTFPEQVTLHPNIDRQKPGDVLLEKCTCALILDWTQKHSVSRSRSGQVLHVCSFFSATASLHPSSRMRLRDIKHAVYYRVHQHKTLWCICLLPLMKRRREQSRIKYALMWTAALICRFLENKASEGRRLFKKRAKSLIRLCLNPQTNDIHLNSLELLTSALRRTNAQTRRGAFSLDGVNGTALIFQLRASAWFVWCFGGRFNQLSVINQLLNAHEFYLHVLHFLNWYNSILFETVSSK